MDDNKYPGPYRATKLWNEAISIFRNGMPLKRHRKHIKHYDNCFTGGEAINWLQQTLRQNPNFGPDINREKTAQLLNKFYKVGVFQSVCSGSSDSIENFKESQLYQFCSRSPLRTLKLSALASINNQQLLKGKLLRRSVSKCSDKERPKRSFSFQSNFMEGVKSRAASNQLRLMEIEEVWKTVVLGRLQALMGNMNIDDFLIPNQTSGLWIMKNAHAIDKEPLHLSFNQAQLFPRWILAAMKSLIDWPHQSGSISSSFQYMGFERDVFRVIRDYFRSLESPLITSFLYESFMNAYSYVKYIESVSYIETSETRFHSAESKVPSKSLEDLFQNVAPVTKEKYIKPERITHPQIRESCQSYESGAMSLNSSKVSSGNKVVTDKVSPTKFDDSVSGHQNDLESLQFINADKFFSASLPPNTCFETAFTSESPVTRIISRKLVEDIHISHKQRCQSLSRNTSFVEPHSLSLGTNDFSVPSTFFSSKIKRNASAPNVTDSNFQPLEGQFVNINPVRYVSSNVNSHESCSESLPSYTAFPSAPINNSDKRALLASQGKFKKSLPEESEEHIKRKKKIKSENVPKLQHVRNQSGGYVNLALSYSADELGKSECFDQLLGEDLDYNAALETLQNLMKCATNYEERKPHSNSKCDEIGNQSYSSASSLWSYHTADSGEHSFHTPTPITLSNLQENDDARNWACDIVTNSGIQTLKGQQLGIEILQLLLLLLPPVNRYKLQLLLCFMSNIEENGRLVLEDGIFTRNLVLDTFTNSILHPELPQKGDENISRHLVAFFLDNHEILFDVPLGLKSEVDSHLSQMTKQDLYSGPPRLTYCEQVSCEQFEEQKLTDSQQALAELLDQIILDSKMGSKEKKKRLKMFKEAYPHIYYRKFPENNKENIGHHSKHKGLLHFTSRLRL